VNGPASSLRSDPTQWSLWVGTRGCFESEHVIAFIGMRTRTGIPRSPIARRLRSTWRRGPSSRSGPSLGRRATVWTWRSGSRKRKRIWRGWECRRSITADRGHHSEENVFELEALGIDLILRARTAVGRPGFRAQDFCYLPEEDVYLCPAGVRLTPRGPRRWKRAGAIKPPAHAVSVASTSGHAVDRHRAEVRPAPLPARRSHATGSGCAAWRRGGCWTSTGNGRKGPGPTRSCMEAWRGWPHAAWRTPSRRRFCKGSAET
jgi:hypothetical protein